MRSKKKKSVTTSLSSYCKVFTRRGLRRGWSGGSRAKTPGHRGLHHQLRSVVSSEERGEVEQISTASGEAITERRCSGGRRRRDKSLVP